MGLKILVVDDSHAERIAIEELLVAHGHIMLWAETVRG